MKRLKNIFLRVFFSGCLLFALLTAAQAAEPTRYEVNTAAELVNAALAVNAAGGEAEIVLKADITLSKAVWQAAQTTAGLPAGDDALRRRQRALRTEARTLLRRAAEHLDAHRTEFPEYDPTENILKRCSTDGGFVQMR